MDELGESGQTFQGMLNWIEKARPTIVIIENVFGAPWDEKVSIFESLGYAATFIRIIQKIITYHKLVNVVIFSPY